MISGGSVEAVKIPLHKVQDGVHPYVEILEQPASKALRFRYECEGRSAGSIPGWNSTPEVKTFPSIKVAHYKGHGVVVVSCVTKDYPHRPHPHSIVGKDTCTQGVCRMEFTPENPVVTFANLGIQCVKKKDIYEALRIREEIRVDPFGTGYDHKTQPAGIDLNSVRLCFQVFIEGRDGKINVPLRPVVSEPIYDKKAMSDLVICKMSHYSATVAGGMEMVILCEKVAKDNIQVRFFEKRDGREVWEGLGDFKSIHVHKQVAIAFRTPSYRHRQVDEPIQVYVQLRRPTDGVTSDPLPFQFLPLGADDHDSLRRKRQKFDENPRAHVLRHVQAEAEKQAVLLNDPLDYNFDPMKLEARVRSIPVVSMIPASTGLVPLYPVGARSTQSPSSNPSPQVDVPAYGAQASPASLASPMPYASYNMPLVPSQSNVNQQFQTPQNSQPCRQQQQQQQTSKNHQPSSSHFDFYHQQQDIVLQKVTTLQPTFQRNVIPEELEGAVGGTGLMDVGGHQSCSFDASLNQLDSAELALFGVALSETLSSGLSITDSPVKSETPRAMGGIPVSVGASASWCGM